VNALSLGLSLTTPHDEKEAINYPALVCRSLGQLSLEETLAHLIEQLLKVEGVKEVIFYKMAGSTKSSDYGLLRREFLRIFGHEGIPTDTHQIRGLLKAQSSRLEKRVNFYRQSVPAI
jgi:hypothetical protein